ncbi:recombination protein NinG [Chitinophaga nivalis]|uniref:recombination protein NinG n=1 Tax=Chitinophaga nivalis TaxID=2991709 RepID=UPI003530AD53
MELSAKTIQKYKGRGISFLLREAETVFNRYIRQRDSQDGYFKCISCQEYKPVSKMHAGHFMSAGHHTAVRFNEDNVHGQCEKCNTFLHGNLISYQENLIKKIGQDSVDIIKSTCRNTAKWHRIDLISIIETYKGKLK